MAQWVKELMEKPHDPNSIPGIHMVEGESEFLGVFLRPPLINCVCLSPNSSTHTYTNTHIRWVDG